MGNQTTKYTPNYVLSDEDRPISLYIEKGALAAPASTLASRQQQVSVIGVCGPRGPTALKMGNKRTKHARKNMPSDEGALAAPASTLLSRQRKVLFIGVSGPTGSGKSTVAAALAKELDSPLRPIGADFFFKFPGSRGFGCCPKHPFHTCSEHPDSVDHALLLKELQSVKEMLETSPVIPEIVINGGSFVRGKKTLNVKSKEGSNIGKEFGKSPVVVVVEGFLLFADKNLTAFLDYCLFLDLKCDTACRRRFCRDFKADKAKDSNLLYRCWRDVEYRSHMWPHFEEFKPLQLQNVRETGKTCGHVNAELSREQIKANALQHLQPLKHQGSPISQK